MSTRMGRTAIAALMSASMIVPHGAFAQQAMGQCERGGEVPCRAPDGQVIETKNAMRAILREAEIKANEGAGIVPCVAAPTVPCVTPEGELLQTQGDLRRFLNASKNTNQQNDDRACEQGVELPCVTADGETVKSIKRLRTVLGLPPLNQNDNEQANQNDNQNQQATQNQNQQGNQPPQRRTTTATRTCEIGVDLPCTAPDGETVNSIKRLRTVMGLPPLDQAGNAPAVDPDRSARREARAAARAEARNDAAAGRSGQGRVTTERVTRENTRRSNEDFESSASSNDKKEPLLTDFQKVLALGLGAVAVGAILRNGDRVEANSGDRVVVSRDGELAVLKDDDALLRRPGSEVRTETFDDGSTRSIVVNEDGSETITIRAADGRVLRRAKVLPDGRQVLLFDDLQESAPVQVSLLPRAQAPNAVADGSNSEAELRRALESALYRDTGRRYSLWQVREIRAVRELAPEIELSAITFASGSAAIEPGQARELIALGQAMSDIIAARPEEVFLVEGHTDATGSEALNLALSDRRAETVALALTEYFDVPPENMITQGYGETALKIPTEAAESRNRRAVVRRITGLLNGTDS